MFQQDCIRGFCRALFYRGYIIILSTQNAKHYSHAVTPTHFLFDIKIISWNIANVFRLVHVLINSNDVNSIIYSAPVPWIWQYISVTNTQNLESSMELVSFHDDVIKWKHFPRNWPFVRGIHRSRWIPHTKASDAELWCFLWSASE